LARLLATVHAEMNLITVQPLARRVLRVQSSTNRIHRFARIVNAGGLGAPARPPRGRDILAARGQLESASLRGRRQRVRNPEEKPII
jgi:23S rRNA (adenine2503-C2)-methyltransferase